MNRIIACAIGLALSTSPLCAQDIPLSKILVEKEGWRKVADAARAITFLEGLPNGDVAVNYGGAHGVFTSNGELLPGPKVVRFRTVQSASTGHGNYAIEGNTVGFASSEMPGFQIDAAKLRGLKSPTCLAFWPDQGHLVIGEADGAYLWAVRIERDGSFGPGDRYYSLRTRPNEKMHVTAMTMDAGYLLYACTPLGIQVFDPTGRLCGVIAAPAKETMTAITIGGAKADELFVAAGDKIFARKIQGKASYTLKKDK